MKAHNFRGRRWRIGEAISGDDIPMGGMKGYCEGPPTAPDREMLVPISGTSIEDLETLIHEPLHACIWDASEDCIHETSKDIARFLWRLGWRNEDQ